jgi:hypothetical protein
VASPTSLRPGGARERVADFTQLPGRAADYGRMLHHRVLAVIGLLIALVPTACAPQSGDSGPDELHHPVWLTGTLSATNKTTAGQTQVQILELRADGSAVDTWRTIEDDLPQLDPRESNAYVDWSLDGSSLQVDSLTRTMHVAANCHLVQLDDRVFQHGSDSPIAGCPQAEAPLTEQESAFVGGWSYSNEDGAYIFMWFNADRRLSVTLGMTAASIESTFSVAKDGTLHAQTPDGVDTFDANVTLTSTGRLRWCEGKDCTVLHR